MTSLARGAVGRCGWGTLEPACSVEGAIGLGVLVAALALSACQRSHDEAAPVPTASAHTASTTLEAGDPAPDVALTLQDGQKVSLRALSGQPVVVYFYPKDDTSGCTLEATGIRDAYADFKAANIRVFGVSTQDAASHQAFIAKYNLPFDLVVDTDGAVAKAFHVPVVRQRAARQTFLIDAAGKIRKVWHEVSPAEHAAELLAAAK